MGTAVRKTISLPADPAREAEALARAEGGTLSAVIQDAPRQSRIARCVQELRGILWSPVSGVVGLGITHRELTPESLFGRLSCHSTLAPDSFTTRPHFSLSFLRNALNSSAFPPATSVPRLK